jgi:hypothetical protein
MQFIHQIQLTCYRILALPEHNSLTANIIHPATQKHLEKYLSSPAHLVCETPELYQAVTLPALQGGVLLYNGALSAHRILPSWTIKTPNPKCRLFLKIYQ